MKRKQNNITWSVTTDYLIMFCLISFIPNCFENNSEKYRDCWIKWYWSSASSTSTSSTMSVYHFALFLKSKFFKLVLLISDYNKYLLMIFIQGTLLIFRLSKSMMDIHPPNYNWKVELLNVFSFFLFFFNWDSLHARLNSHYEVIVQMSMVCLHFCTKSSVCNRK